MSHCLNCRELEAERDGIKARSLAVIRARDADLITVRDAYSVAMSRIAALEAELEAAQQAVEAFSRKFNTVDRQGNECPGSFYPWPAVTCHDIRALRQGVLARPGVQAVLK